MRTARLLPLLGLLALYDCGPIVAPASTIPTNACTGDSLCPSYCPPSPASCDVRCNGVACVSPPSTLPPFVLLVTVPEGSAFGDGQGLTYVLQNPDLLCAQDKSDCGQAATQCKMGQDGTNPCVQLLPASTLSGAYVVENVFGGVDFPGTDTSIPVRTTFIPKWPPCSTTACPTVQVVAASLNLPLPNVSAVATITLSGLPVVPKPTAMGTVDEPTVGPGGSSAVGWIANVPFNANLPFSIESNFYAVDPVSPWDQLVPPLTESSSTKAPIDDLAVVVSAPPETAITLKGVTDPEGWSVYWREVNPPQRIVSSQPTFTKLPSGDGFAALYTFESLTPTSGLDVVVTPPPNAATPQLVGGSSLLEVTGMNMDMTTTFGTISYPPLPDPVTVHGTVVDEGTHPIEASLHFVGTSLFGPPSASGACGPGLVASILAYDVFVPTTDVGTYSVTLPQGSYSVTIDPGFSADVAKTTIPSRQFVAKGCPSGGNLEGEDLMAENPVEVTGSAQIADGRPLVNAEVDFTPSGLLLQQKTPMGGLLATADWPRPVSVVTDAKGFFSADVDPNAFGLGTYDVTVRPLNGTSLPWVVLPGLAVQASSAKTTVTTLHVPAPAELGPLTIHDSQDDPVGLAVVQAYAFTACNPPSAGCLGPAVKIGEAITDGTTGTFSMLLAPSPLLPQQ
jgi:hypothetical protein